MFDQPVWYAAYGSNLSAERFLLYLAGGRPADGQRTHPGARDPSPPRDDRVAHVPGVMGFAGRSLRWSGGTSVLHHEAPGRSIARLWSISTEQVADVAAQECALEPGEFDVDLDEVVARRSVVCSPRRYGRLVHLGHREGRPIVTMTSPRATEPAEPGPEYLAVVRAGLLECGMTPAEADTYLARRPGVGLVRADGGGR
ncbi:MAG: histone deacetylase [Actinomycetota bacterium]